MFDQRSRYFDLEDRWYEDESQRTIVYKSRRFLSRDENRPVLKHVATTPSDRPDLLAARTLQSPDLFWRLCDANSVMHPFELTDRSRRRIRILMPGA